jgi:hypothetical protein
VEQSVDDRRLGEELGLAGYALSTDRARSGEALYATLYWQALVQIGLDYEIEVRLVGEDGRTVWQQAGSAYDGYFPTSWWKPGRTMYDRYRIPLPGDLASGRYEVVAGAREPDSGRALPAYGPVQERWPDHLLVGPIQVEGAP